MSLSKGWGVATVEELTGPGGFVSDGDWVESKDQDSTGKVRLTQLADIGDGSFRDRSARFMTEEAAERLRCTYLEPRDVLIARMPDPIGRACIFPELGQPAVTAVDVMIWRTDGKLAEAEWFVRWINSPAVRRLMAEGAGGTTRQRIAGGRVKEITLPVPPVAEQRRIVAKLDALTARIARARAELDRVPVLASMLRSRCLSVVWQHAPRCSLSNYIAFPIRNGLSVKGSDTPPGVSALRLSSIRNRTVDLNDVRYLPIDETRAAAYSLTDGDVLVSRGNGTLSLVGKASRVENVPLDRPIIFPDTAFRIRLDPRKASARWLTFVWNSAVMRQQIEAKARTTAGIWKISQGDLNSFSLPKLSVPEQEKSADLIEATFARADRLEAEAARARKLLDRLESAILAKAFRGELVPQDDNDEPAEELLERIRAERAAAPKAKRVRKSRA